MIDEVVTMLGMDLHEIDAIAVSGGMSAEDAMAECVATSNAALQE